LRLSEFLVELSCIFITVVNVNVSAVNRYRLAQSEVVGCKELAILAETLFSSEETLADWDTAVLLPLLIHLDGVVLQIK
jgi:hypothetical protein